MLSVTTERSGSSSFPDDNGDHMQSLARGLSVMAVFGSQFPQMTLAQVAEKTSLSRASARRCLITLVREGYAVTDGKYFSLSPKVLDLGYAFLSSMPFWERAKPIVDDVVRKTGETTSIAVLDHADIVFVVVARLPTRIVMLNLGVGSRLPAYATSTGRVLLSSLPEHRLDEYLKTIKLEKLTTKTITDRQKLRSAIAQASASPSASASSRQSSSVTATS